MKTTEQIIRKIIKGWAHFEIGSSPSGYNAHRERVPEKKCSECGGTKEYAERVFGLGETPREAIEKLYKELQKYEPPYPRKEAF